MELGRGEGGRNPSFMRSHSFRHRRLRIGVTHSAQPQLSPLRRRRRRRCILSGTKRAKHDSLLMAGADGSRPGTSSINGDTLLPTPIRLFLKYL